MLKIFPDKFFITVITFSLVFLLAGCWAGKQPPKPQPSDPLSIEVPSPDPQPPASSTDERIPGGGGELYGDKNTEYGFRPDSTGLWLFMMIVEGDGSSDIGVFDQNGDPVSPQRTGGGDYDSFLVAQFDEGITYTIRTILRPYKNGTPMSYTLTVSPAVTIPGGGGDARAHGYYSVFTFTPDQSGAWEFRTSDANIRSEWLGAPFLVLSDISDYYLEDFVHSPMGEGENDWLLTMDLDAGTTYRISVELSSDIDSCALTVSLVD